MTNKRSHFSDKESLLQKLFFQCKQFFRTQVCRSLHMTILSDGDFIDSSTIFPDMNSIKKITSILYNTRAHLVRKSP